MPNSILGVVIGPHLLVEGIDVCLSPNWSTFAIYTQPSFAKS